LRRSKKDIAQKRERAGERKVFRKEDYSLSYWPLSRKGKRRRTRTVLLRGENPLSKGTFKKKSWLKKVRLLLPGGSPLRRGENYLHPPKKDRYNGKEKASRAEEKRLFCKKKKHSQSPTTKKKNKRSAGSSRGRPVSAKKKKTLDAAGKKHGCGRCAPAR